MPKVRPLITLRDGPTDYLTSADFKFRANIYDWLKARPGCTWNAGNRRWYIPSDLVDEFVEFVDPEFAIRDERTPLQLPYLDAHPALWDPQKRVTDSVLSRFGGIIIGEMGTGKTGMTIDMLRRLQLRTGLVVCPASARMSWEDDFAKPIKEKYKGELTGRSFYWWETHPELIVITKGKEASLLTQEDVVGKVVICSYDLVGKLIQLKWQFMIADEAHHLTNYRTKRHKNVKVIAEKHPRDVFKVALTGTPIRKAAQNIHGIIDAIWPGRVGTYYRFTDQYCHVYSQSIQTGGPDGERSIRIVDGISEDPTRADALNRRLEKFAPRITQHEIKEFLPQLTSRVVRLRVATASDDLQVLGQQKRKDVVGWLVDLLKHHERHIVVGAHHRAVVEAYKKDLAAADIPVGIIYGGDSDDKRRKTLDRLQKFDRSVLVASIVATCEGLNVFHYIDDAVIGELTYRAPVLTQWLGRFRRPNRDKPCRVHMFFADGSKEEAMVMALDYALDQMRRTVGHGVTEESALELLGGAMPDESQIQEKLRAAIGTQFDIEGWGELFNDD